MPTLRFIGLEAEEDARLREIEYDLHIKPRVRLRAQVLRLSNWGATIEQIAAYTSRSRVSVGRDFDRWEERGSKKPALVHDVVLTSTHHCEQRSTAISCIAPTLLFCYSHQEVLKKFP